MCLWMHTPISLRTCAAALLLASLLPVSASAQDAPFPEPQVQDEIPLPDPNNPQSEDFGLPGLDAPPGFALPDETPALPAPEPKAQAPAPRRDENVARPKPQDADQDREQDRDQMLAELYSHLAKAPDAEQSAPIAKTIETLWLRSGSDTIGLLMRRAFKAVEEQRMDLALQLLDAVVELGPDYAEGWSRRAYVHYLKNDYTSAVGDLRRTLALEPNHYKALEGLGRILREGGQKKSALKVYQELLRIYPHMPGAKEAADELTVEVEGQGI